MYRHKRERSSRGSTNGRNIMKRSTCLAKEAPREPRTPSNNTMKQTLLRTPSVVPLVYVGN